MTVKLMVLYPHPVNEEEFEREYVGKHLPLMRELLGPGVPLPTYRTVAAGDGRAPFYRVAEIHFDDVQHFERFARSEKAGVGRESSIGVSTGGTPLVFLCEQQPEV